MHLKTKQKTSRFVQIICRSLCLAALFAVSSVVGEELPATPNLPPNAQQLGAKIQRAMTLMATSTPEKRNRVKVLFYGQSISAGSWSKEVGDYLKKKYPHADLEIANHSRGGHSAPVLIKCADSDLYPFYPDLLIFHVYGGDDTGELEEIIARARRYTTADILLWTPHYRWPRSLPRDGSWEDPEMARFTKEDEHHAERLREIAKKYNCEMADIRPQWLEYVKQNDLRVKDLLSDGTHPNQLGHHLLAALVKPYLNYTGKETVADWQDRILDIPASSSEICKLANGALELTFDGNRVDIITDPEVASPGSAKVLLDGKPPSANSECFTMTRSTKMWGHYWPALRRMTWNSPLLVEDWTARVLDVDEKTGRIDFEVIGSETGHDGKGNTKEKFVSNSGRIVTDDESWVFQDKAFFKSKGQVPVGYEVKWSAVALSKDEYRPEKRTDKHQENVMTLIQGISNGKHVLRLEPTGDAPLAIKGFRVYRPTVKVALDSALSVSIVRADVISMGTFSKIGADADATVSGQSSSGATMTYSADTDSRFDGGISSLLNSSGGGVTFTNIGDKLTCNLTYNFSVAGSQFTPAFRVGFDFGSSAFVYHATSTGSGPSLQFWSNADGTLFTQGVQSGATVSDWSDFAHRGIRLDDGNTINATVSLTLQADNGNSTYDYLYEVTYVNRAFSNTASQVITNVAGLNVVSLNLGGNARGLAAAGDMWTVSNVSVEFSPRVGNGEIL